MRLSRLFLAIVLGLEILLSTEAISEIPDTCALVFKETSFCAIVDWTDGPITFVENKIDLSFYDQTTERKISPPYKLKVRAWNYYEEYWAPEPDIILPKDNDPTGSTWIRNLFFDRPGLWYVYFELWNEELVDQSFIKLHLEDFGGIH